MHEKPVRVRVAVINIATDLVDETETTANEIVKY
jgi:hypothetical protein